MSIDGLLNILFTFLLCISGGILGRFLWIYFFDKDPGIKGAVAITVISFCLIIVIAILQSDLAHDLRIPEGIDDKNINLQAAYNNKGYSLYMQGKYEDAIRCYNRAIEIDPKYTIAWNNKGKALSALNRDREAEAMFSKAKDLAN